ncbi:molybdopterin synthase catalytic subunit MoaE [Glaciecola petra]|uniref:Molybdopterin synthase catalytic subunit n=1 Tax=Glaciecola petra TaxID=3075602 RepID=A0ABU2ZUJ1_9ALTE|nr:molybdopterin synthase catalytic subunit MoaE [Aestuariibacter sp. P117]MDT0596313.1 molybdopterin synthase catalytic subunit MoaE [Aestuariibacter sp. P117]
MKISVQKQDFDVSKEYQYLIQNNQEDGALSMFVGRVRNRNEASDVRSLELEHYPEMTQRSLSNIAIQAKQKWPIGKVSIIHRFGKLTLGEQIVFVGVTSAHREAAYQANQFIMDFLKTRAPFWKKETRSTGDVWIDANEKDKKAALKWE